jgi:hypothetical protein
MMIHSLFDARRKSLIVLEVPKFHTVAYRASAGNQGSVSDIVVTWVGDFRTSVGRKSG